MTRNFILGRNRIRDEATELLKLKRHYATRDTIELSQLFSGVCGAQLEKVKHYTDYCEHDTHGAMGDLGAAECNIPLLVRECFDANIVLERNLGATSKIATLFFLYITHFSKR